MVERLGMPFKPDRSGREPPFIAAVPGKCKAPDKPAGGVISLCPKKRIRRRHPGGGPNL